MASIRTAQRSAQRSVSVKRLQTKNAVRLIWLLTITTAISPISQLSLAPSFGHIPSSVNHSTMICLTIASGMGIGHIMQSSNARPQYLAVWSFWIPVLQLLILPFHKDLGVVGGPIAQGFLSCHTLLFMSAMAIGSTLYRLYPQAGLPRYASVAIEAGIVILCCLIGDQALKNLFISSMTRIPSLTVIHLQVLLACCYAVLAPSWLLLLAVPAIYHSLGLNTHNSIETVNAALASQKWQLLDRRWSDTGYISVLENLDDNYRMMRCDHSFLGGEWQLTPERRKQGWTMQEPVYAVFVILEAVRLMETEYPVADRDAQALIIGLGIGTAPKAFLSHGIDTTVVELDPVVHEYAGEYFNLPSNHTLVLQDAVTWARTEALSIPAPKQYDYILHDVFTGGAEPLALFTWDFLTDLRRLLRPNGLIAINYAGDLHLPLTYVVLQTIDAVFDNGECKIFRDSARSDDSGGAQGEGGDFLNLVVFCRNTRGAINFRDPTPADLLGSQSRAHYMLPKPANEIRLWHSYNEHVFVDDLAQTVEPWQAELDAKHYNFTWPSYPPLRIATMHLWHATQVESAKRHWRIMRDTTPDAVWDMW